MTEFNPKHGHVEREVDRLQYALDRLGNAQFQVHGLLWNAKTADVATAINHAEDAVKALKRWEKLNTDNVRLGQEDDYE